MKLLQRTIQFIFWTTIIIISMWATMELGNAIIDALPY